MDVELFFYDAEQEGDVSEETAAMFPAYYADRFRSARVDSVRQQAAGSALLLKEYFGVTSDEQLIRGEHGQLSVKGDPRSLCLSHSGPVTVLAVSDEPVGVDLERIHAVSDPTVRRVFPPEFQAEMEAASEEDRDETFTRLWTRLEAALKLDGRGLTAPRTEFGKILERYEITTKQIGDHFLSIAVPNKK